MIQVYKKNGLFIIQDTCRDILYPNLTRDEAISKLKEFNREEDRVDYAIENLREDQFKYEELENLESQIKELKEQIYWTEKGVELVLLMERHRIYEEIREKSVFSKYGYMGKTEKGYYTIYAGTLEQIEKGEEK